MLDADTYYTATILSNYGDPQVDDEVAGEATAELTADSAVSFYCEQLRRDDHTGYKAESLIDDITEVVLTDKGGTELYRGPAKCEGFDFVIH